MFLCMCMCGCVCRRWGAIVYKCNSDGEISSRCVTAAHKVSAAVIRIPLNREEQPTLPTANVSAAHSPAGRPHQLPTAPILTLVKKKNWQQVTGDGCQFKRINLTRPSGFAKERPHSHSARDVLGLIYAAPYSMWLQMHPGMRPGCRMINLEDLGCVHTGSVKSMNEADPSDGEVGKGAAWEPVVRRRRVQTWLGFVARVLPCPRRSHCLPARSACHIPAAAKGLAHWGPFCHRTRERKKPPPLTPTIINQTDEQHAPHRAHSGLRWPSACILQYGLSCGE